MRYWASRSKSAGRICIHPAVLAILLLAGISSADNGSHEPTPADTPEQERAYDERMRREIKAKAERMRKAAEARRAAEAKAAEERRRQWEAKKYKMDPALAEAFREHLSDTRDRDKAERMLLEYIQGNPESPFIPEVYFHLGAMYTCNRAVPKEKRDRRKADAYFAQSHKLFGDKFGTAHDCAWSYLVMKRAVPLVQKREYYDWVRRSRELGADAIWPYREIQICMIYGKPPELSDAEKAERARNWQRGSEQFITACERTLMMYADPHALAVYARDYPGTELGRRAKAALQKREGVLADELMKDLEAFMAGSPDATAGSTTRQATGASSEAPSEVPVQKGAGTSHSGSMTTIWYAGVAGAVLIAGLAALWLARRKNRVASRPA